MARAYAALFLLHLAKLEEGIQRLFGLLLCHIRPVGGFDDFLQSLVHCGGEYEDREMQCDHQA